MEVLKRHDHVEVAPDLHDALPADWPLSLIASARRNVYLPGACKASTQSSTVTTAILLAPLRLLKGVATVPFRKHA